MVSLLSVLEMSDTYFSHSLLGGPGITSRAASHSIGAARSESLDNRLSLSPFGGWGEGMKAPHGKKITLLGRITLLD